MYLPPEVKTRIHNRSREIPQITDDALSLLTLLGRRCYCYVPYGREIGAVIVNGEVRDALLSSLTELYRADLARKSLLSNGEQYSITEKGISVVDSLYNGAEVSEDAR